MLPKLTISNHYIERKEFIKFLEVLLDENLNWKEHIKYTENKIAKNLGLLHKARPFLERNALLAPLLWNKILTSAEKNQESLPKFQTTVKEKLLSMTHEMNYFGIGNIKANNQFLSELNYSNSIILHSR